MKTAGMLCLFTACLWIGAAYCRARRQRLAVLRDLCKAMEQMEGELASRSSPLPELCRLLATGSEGDVRAFFTRIADGLAELGELRFSELWKRAARDTLFCLRPFEMDALLRLGSSLGRYELDRQLGVVKACSRTLERCYRAAQQSMTGELKVGMGLAAAAGALLVIAMW
ncbi:MAG: stage III sporulation protein AB [Oscillospiraceae bacterium]|nr:stage III sporulation protein AB [Oscillospiraceae bacterium]